MGIKGFAKAVYLKTVSSGIFNVLPDKVIIPIIYKFSTGKKLNLSEPRSFNEKLQWIKLYDHNPMYTLFSDKYAVRKYVADKISEKYLIPLLGHWENVDEIDFRDLPKQFVLKCNHDSGGVIICRDKKSFNIDDAKKKLRKHFARNYYYLSREWAYKDIKKCIICEKYMIDEESGDLRDYKFFCFNGVPKLIQVDFDRFTDHKRNLYSTNWELLDLTIKCPNDPNRIIPKPEKLEEMLELASELSRGYPQLRVDFYFVNGNVYFGELTVYHGGGIEKFTPESFGDDLGDQVDLSLAYME